MDKVNTTQTPNRAMIFLMTHETGPENANPKETLETRTTNLAKALDTTPPPRIDFTQLYAGESLKAIEPYDGAPMIFEAFKRLRNFVAEFRNEIDAGVQRVGPETLERAEISFAILSGVHQGVGLEDTEKRAADVIAKDVLRRAKTMKDANLLDEDTRATINYLYTQIRLLLDEGKVAGRKPDNLENRFPLAFTTNKVLEIERLMTRVLGESSADARDQKGHRNGPRREVQQRVQPHVRKRKR